MSGRVISPRSRPERGRWWRANPQAARKPSATAASLALCPPALAQETDILLLDEPTTFLDWGYQLEVLELLSTLNRQHGLTVVMSLHDLNQAAQFADRVAVLADGQLDTIGSPREVITETLINRVFRVKTTVTLGPDDRPFCSGFSESAREGLPAREDDPIHAIAQSQTS